MVKTEEERLREVEDTLLLLPSELTDIKNTQIDIIEHLETINGSFGEFDGRLHSVETKWDYQEKDDEKKKESKKQFLNITNVLIAGIAVIWSLVVVFLA